MANPCGQVHMPNMACRECDRVRQRPVSAVVDGTGVEHAKAHIAQPGGGTKRRARTNRIDVIGIVEVPASQTVHMSTRCDPEKFDAPAKTSDRPKARVEADPDGVGVAVSEGVEDSGKPGRLAVARDAATEALTRYRAKNAARQKRYRERMRSRRKK